MNDTPIPNYIKVPSVDQQIINRQYAIFKDVWPTLSPEAQRAFPVFARIYTEVKRFNLPNFMGARVTVPSGLNLLEWERKLQYYHDNEICYFLRFG